MSNTSQHFSCEGRRTNPIETRNPIWAEKALRFRNQLLVSVRMTNRDVTLTNYHSVNAPTPRTLRSNAHKQPNTKFQYEPYSPTSRMKPVHPQLLPGFNLLLSAERRERTYRWFPFPTIKSCWEIRIIQMNAWRAEVDREIEWDQDGTKSVRVESATHQSTESTDGERQRERTLKRQKSNPSLFFFLKV